MTFCLRNHKRLSQCKQIVDTNFGHLIISFPKWCSLSAFATFLSRVINSYSIVDLDMTIYFENFHDTIAPLRVNMNSLVEFESLYPHIQFASL